jgi:hypothetical protein
MSYTGQLSHRARVAGQGIFAASGLGRAPRARGIFGSLFGLGQTKPGSEPVDNTASDWASAISAFAPVVTGIVGAATGTPTTPAAATTPTIDPSTAYSPPVSASADWYWPVVIGVGVALFGGIAYMSWSVKAPVKSNRRRRLRRNYAYDHMSHFGSYDDRGRPKRNGRRRSSRR